jgi:hypothetical protein
MRKRLASPSRGARRASKIALCRGIGVLVDEEACTGARCTVAIGLERYAKGRVCAFRPGLVFPDTGSPPRTTSLINVGAALTGRADALGRVERMLDALARGPGGVRQDHERQPADGFVDDPSKGLYYRSLADQRE